MAPETRMPQPGYVAPRIEALSVNAGNFSLAAQRGKWVVVYFFPKAGSQACTHEAQEFQRHKSVFEELDTTVVGISPDKLEVQRQFASSNGIAFPLIADTARDIIGAWGARAVLGGAARATFLVDPNGKIARAWPKVKVEGHAGDVVVAIRSEAAAAKEKK